MASRCARLSRFAQVPTYALLALGAMHVGFATAKRAGTDLATTQSENNDKLRRAMGRHVD